MGVEPRICAALSASIDDLSADKASFWATGRIVRPCEM